MWFKHDSSAPDVEPGLADVLDLAARGVERGALVRDGHHSHDGGRRRVPPGRTADMSDKDGRRPAPSGNGPVKPRPALEAGFDRWLDRQLHEIYDPVLDEAIPDEIASLLERFARGPAGGGEGGGPDGQGGGRGLD
jgi:hypothetical protein